MEQLRTRRIVGVGLLVIGVLLMARAFVPHLAAPHLLRALPVAPERPPVAAQPQQPGVPQPPRIAPPPAVPERPAPARALHHAPWGDLHRADAWTWRGWYNSTVLTLLVLALLIWMRGRARRESARSSGHPLDEMWG